MLTDIEFDRLLATLLEELQERLPPIDANKITKYPSYRSPVSDTTIRLVRGLGKYNISINYGVDSFEGKMNREAFRKKQSDIFSKAFRVYRQIKDGKEGCDLC